MSLSLPQLSYENDASTAESSEFQEPTPPPKFPHIKGQLSLMARQYKPLENYDSDTDAEELNRVSAALVTKVVALLDEEKEDELKKLLKDTYAMDDEALEQNMLDLMHKHRDDVAGVPFLFLTPTRRPISRPSSRASTNSARLHPARPDTPSSAPNSPLSIIFRRPHTPVTSPLAGGTQQPSSYMTVRSASDYSPHSSPILAHAQATQAHAQFTASLPASPLSSPRLLNAKASEFKPIPRPLSASSFNPNTFAASALRAETPSPDLWAHNSPRVTSNLAIAAPLIPEQSLLTRSLTPSSSLRSSHRPGEDNQDVGDDPFDPFAPKGSVVPFHSITVSDFDNQWSNSSNSTASRSPEDYRSLDQLGYQLPYDTDFDSKYPPSSEIDNEMENALLTDGMTPFDVLSSVFGSTLAPSELEEALAANGYDFERAMAWLVDKALPSPPQSSQVRVQQLGGRVSLVSRDGQGGAPIRGGRGGFQNTSPPSGRAAPRYVNGRPVPSGNRVCRYFVAGECLRADCRFSHDLERALCRFWLRGTCAKQDQCEFLHHLPKDVDVTSLTAVLARANLTPGTGPLANHNLLSDEFPSLNFDNGTPGKGRKGAYGDRPYINDPGRNRFATAVKKPAAVAASQVPENPALAAARREAMGNSADSLYHRSAIIAPRPSPRLNLRPPTLLPTLPTGESINSLYMAYRSRALQLGAARNACLSRAADAWRRGDGAAAKRFSREGQDLNAKMATEMASAASKLVRERAKVAEQAVRARDANWSDDPGDRTARGKSCGGGLGICLGVACQNVGGEGKTTAEERTECVLDLHGLHANEATEVLEEFLLALEREHFYGFAYIIVGEEKHTGTQDAARGASRSRLATGVREWVHRWGYPWSERDGILCVDPLTHASE